MRNTRPDRSTRHAMLCALLCASLVTGCASEEPASAPVQSPSPPTVAVSADWLNGSVTFLDADRLVAAGSTLEEALIERVTLASPGGHGPLTVATTADGRRAIVLLSPGVMAFVGGRFGIDAESLPDSGAAVVVLDLDSRQVVAEFPVDGLPIMTAIDDGRGRAFVSILGGRGVNGSIAVYDLNALEKIEQVELVPFIEGLAINDAGTRGAAIGAANGLYLFDPADLSGSLSQTPLRLADDSSGVTFISGTDRLVVANSRNPSNFVVIDASDMDAPAVIDEGEGLDAVPFMVAAVPNREEVVMPLSRNASLRFLHLDVSQTPARVLHDIEVPDVLTFPEAVTVSPDGRYAFVGAEVSKELLIFDLVNGGVQRRPWLDEMGPTALTVVP